MSDLDAILERIQGLPEEEREELKKLAVEGTKDRVWVPNPGPQTEAYFSDAYLTLYGGAGGGGKSDWGLGLAFTEHQRALIMRRKYTDLSGLTERAIQINGTRKGFNGSAPPKLTTQDGRLIEFGAAQHIGDEQSWQGRPHDLLYIDEAAQFAESQIRYLMGWVRSTSEGQRCRVGLGSNPPLSDEGAWMVSMFAPWLDPTHPNPAKPGELRWYVTDEHGDDLEVSGPGEHEVNGDYVEALSRTFIPAKLGDNPYLKNTSYKAQQDALPEPLRSAIRDGNFNASRKDHELQFIPSEWVRAAQTRWTAQPPEGVPQCAIGVDVAQGGDDQTVLAPRHDGWFAPLIKVPGRETPYGRDVAGLVINHRRDNSKVIIDMGGGYGGAAFEQLKTNIDDVIPYKGSEASKRRTKDGVLRYFNKRAEAYGRFKEALDPSQPGGSPIMLPPSATLFADLCSIRLDSDDQHILKLEPKKQMVDRIGRSPDEGDAVVMAWHDGAKTASHYKSWNSGPGRMGRTPQVVMGHKTARRR